LRANKIIGSGLKQLITLSPAFPERKVTASGRITQLYQLALPDRPIAPDSAARGRAATAPNGRLRA